VSVFNKKYPPGSVLRYPTAAENRGYDQGGFDLPSSPAYNVEPVTNTSSSSCANNGRRTPRWVLDARRRSSRLCFSHFATCTVDNTVDLYAAKPDIHPESRFLPTHLHLTPPLGGFPSEYRHPAWYGKTRMVMVWIPDSERILKICLFVLTWSTNVTDRHTDTAWRHRPRLCIASRGKNDRTLVTNWKLCLAGMDKARGKEVKKLVTYVYISCSS